MKKLLLYTVAAVSFVACNDAPLDETPITPQSSSVVTINVKAESTTPPNTRVSYDEEWVIGWDEDDALMAIGEAGGSSKFTIKSDSDISNPTFEGSSLSEDFYLLHPYSAAFDERRDATSNIFDLDLTSQRAGAVKSYMISHRSIASELFETTVMMKHLGATMTLDMKFTGYEGYTIESLEVSGLNSRGYVNIAAGQCDYASALQEPSINTITVTDIATKLTNGDDGAAYAKVRFNIFETTIAEGEGVNVNLYLKSDDGTMVILAKKITNTESAPIDFARATYNTLKCGLSSSDVVNYSDFWTDPANVAEGFAGGNGDESDPYQIETAAQFAYFAQSVNGLNGMSANNYVDKHVKLTADVDLSGHKWSAIGGWVSNIQRGFNGHFDGSGHKVSGLYVNISEEGNQYQGLFGRIFEGSIKDITVSGSVYAPMSQYVGGIVGLIHQSTIENCVNNSTVTGHQYVGGIVGKTNNIEGSLANNYNTGSIFCNGGIVGGIAGYSSVPVTNCYNVGAVCLLAYKWSSSSSYQGVGGIAGNVYGTDVLLTNCYNTAPIENKTLGTDTPTGGVVGYNTYATYKSCYNTGSVKSSSQYVGGIIGYVDRGYPTANTYKRCHLFNCYNTGSVESEKSNVGGVVGYTSGSGDLNIVKLANCYNTGSVKGFNVVGGVMGQCDINCGFFVCYNAGAVDATYNGSTASQGGLIGSIRDGTNTDYGAIAANFFWNKDLISNAIGNDETLLPLKVPYTTEYMQSTAFLDLLHTRAQDYTDEFPLCGWKQPESGTYPILDYDNILPN